MNRPQPPAAASRLPALPHHLFFAVLPGPDEVELVDRLAAALAEQEAPRKRVRAERLHATLFSLGWHAALPVALVEQARTAAAQVDGPAGTLQLDRVLSFRAGPHRPHPRVLCGPPGGQEGFVALHATLHRALWPQARVPTVTPHVTLYCTPQPLPELAVHPMRRAMRSFALLHNVRGSAGPYECLGVWALRAQFAIKNGAASACLESARARFGLNCFKPWS